MLTSNRILLRWVTKLPDDDPVQCESEFCVICNELAMEQQ